MLGTEYELGCYTGPPGYTAWRNWFLGIDSWAPYKFKNSVSVILSSLVSGHQSLAFTASCAHGIESYGHSLL